MKEASWEDCIESCQAIKVTPDIPRARSLTSAALSRVEYIKTLVIDEKSANTLFENYYTSTAELLHAIALLSGYKIENHVCLGFLLKEVLKRESLYLLFDNLRTKRNSLIYSGNRMELPVAREAIQQSEKLIAELKNIILDDQRY